MGKSSSKKLLSAFCIAFFLWCASCEVCNAREVTDRRSSLAATAAATDGDSAAGSSLWLWRGPWRIPYWPFPPFPYHHPWPYLPPPHWPYLPPPHWPYLPPPHWPFWPRPYPRPQTPNPPSTPASSPIAEPPPPHQTPTVKPAPPPAPTAKPTPASAPPTPPTSPAKPTPPASPTTPVEPTPPASPTPTPPVEPKPKPPASSTPPVSPTPPAVPTPPASPMPPASPITPAVPTPPASPTPPAAPMPPVPSNSTTFNVLDFGAKGDGSTDDTKAFQDAWAASCNVEASTMVVPANYVFLVGPITFLGEHCQENIIFQLDGTVIAPTDPQAWADDDAENWLHFEKMSLFTLQGSGTVDGRGSVWWQRPRFEEFDGDLYDVDDDDADHELDYEDRDIKAKDELSSLPRKKPTAMKFHRGLNVTFSGIKIQNSPNVHLTFHDCVGVHVHDMSISSPGDSPNTDGIHLGDSQDVTIHDATLACGDDCISIVSGCSNIHIRNVHCGPGHGISIGSLGKDHSKACVHNITVQDVDLHGTTNGVRIKSWQGGSGSVYGVKFSNIRVSEVRWPIIIDQYYCDHTTCTNQSSAVAVRNVAFENVVGTYTERPVDLACSDSVPCEDITLSGINLRPSSQNPPSHDDSPFCWQTFGQLTTPISPTINCVQTGTPSSNGVRTDQDLC